MAQEKTSINVAAILASQGVTAWGVASNEPRLPMAPPLPVAISLLGKYEAAEFEDMDQAPTAAYYAGYCRLNDKLNAAAEALATALRSGGWAAHAIPATIPESDYGAIEDWCNVPVFAHKTAATQAGLGWIGKTALFISPEYGPRLRLATVFTDVKLPTGKPTVKSRCGSCRACVDACPASAGLDVKWTAGMPRHALYDVKACEQETYKYEELGGVCGVCIVACPWGRSHK